MSARSTAYRQNVCLPPTSVLRLTTGLEPLERLRTPLSSFLPFRDNTGASEMNINNLERKRKWNMDKPTGFPLNLFSYKLIQTDCL